MEAPGAIKAAGNRGRIVTVDEQKPKPKPGAIAQTQPELLISLQRLLDTTQLHRKDRR